MGYRCLREDRRRSIEFRNALNEEHKNYIRKLYSDIDKAVEVDVGLFWKLTKHRKPGRSQIYPEIRDEEGANHTDLRGVAKTFASFYRKLYTPLEDDGFNDVFRNS